MADLTEDQTALFAERVADVLARAKAELDELAERAQKDLCERERFEAQSGDVLTRAKRLFVREFEAAEPSHYDPHTGVALTIPMTAWQGNQGSNRIELERYTGGLFLEPGRYRAVVALVPIESPADKP